MGKFKELPIVPRWLVSLGSCVLLAILCTVAVNPITFMQQGIAFSDMTIRHIFAGYFNYTLIFLLWGVGYLHIDKSILGENHTKINQSNNRIILEKNNELIPVYIANITHIKAAGDYVEIFTDHETYLNRATLSSFVHELNNADFIKSHRSIIVNVKHIKALIPEAKGECQIILRNNVSLKASRTYAASLKQHLINQRHPA